MNTRVKRADKQVLIEAALNRLQREGIPHKVNCNGIHIIVTGPNDQRIDLWPTTAKWMHPRQPVQIGMHEFWKAVAGWGASDGA